jgi:hypothetical protein
MHAHTPCKDYVCGICRPPSRAGKTSKARAKAHGAADHDDVVVSLDQHAQRITDAKPVPAPRVQRAAGML